MHAHPNQQYVVESDFNINAHEADLIQRLSALETLREQAREGNRKAMLSSIENLIEAELRSLQRIRRDKTDAGVQPG